ncbi:MAG: hypothetical protein WC197_02010 [Candidatus Gastranaerophilaceae bacterium]|jgi:hypothetical protein
MDNKLINSLIGKLKDNFKEKLSSIIIYGSCAVENCNEKLSDINLIVIIDKLCASDLQKAHPSLKDWMKTKNPLPLFIDKEEWFDSTDVYPIEYSDIKDRYKILYGENLVEPLIIDSRNLRLQCEHEVKNLLIRLRQTYLAKSSDKKVIENLIKTSSKTFLALFRAVLRLSNESVPFKHSDVINLLAQKIEFDSDIFRKLLSFRTDPKVFKKDEFEIVIQKLIDSTNYILKYVDKI